MSVFFLSLLFGYILCVSVRDVKIPMIREIMYYEAKASGKQPLNVLPPLLFVGVVFLWFNFFFLNSRKWHVHIFFLLQNIISIQTRSRPFSLSSIDKLFRLYRLFLQKSFTGSSRRGCGNYVCVCKGGSTSVATDGGRYRTRVTHSLYHGASTQIPTLAYMVVIFWLFFHSLIRRCFASNAAALTFCGNPMSKPNWEK